jgi:hypothetical protein
VREYSTNSKDYIDNVAARPIRDAMPVVKASSGPVVFNQTCPAQAGQGVYSWKCYLTLNHDGLHSTGAISWPDDYVERYDEQCREPLRGSGTITRSAYKCIRKAGHLGKHFAHTGTMSVPPYNTWSSYVEFETPNTGNHLCNNVSPSGLYYCEADFGHDGRHSATVHSNGIKETYGWR